MEREQIISPEYVVKIGKRDDGIRVAYEVNEINGDNVNTYKIHKPVLRKNDNGNLEPIKPAKTVIPTNVVDTTSNVDTTAIDESSTNEAPTNESGNPFTDMKNPVTEAQSAVIPEVTDTLKDVAELGTNVATTVINKNPSIAAVKAVTGKNLTNLVQQASNVEVPPVKDIPGFGMYTSKQQEERIANAFKGIDEDAFTKAKGEGLQLGGRLTRRRKNQKKHMRKSYKKMHRRRKH